MPSVWANFERLTRWFNVLERAPSPTKSQESLSRPMTLYGFNTDVQAKSAKLLLKKEYLQADDRSNLLIGPSPEIGKITMCLGGLRGAFKTGPGE